MYDAPTHTETTADVAAAACTGGCARCSSDGRAERMGRDVRRLDHLADVAMEMALELRRRLYAQADGDAVALEASVGELSLSFTRVARAMRQSVALKDRIDEARQARLDGEEAAREAVAEEKNTQPESGFERKKQVHELIADAIEDAAWDKGGGRDEDSDAEADHEAERLFEALYERLEDPADEADFEDRPMGELIARICRDLDFTPDWNQWDLEDWAIEEAERNTPGSPYAKTTGRRRLTPPGEKAQRAAAVGERGQAP
jgi:hypothetical protein